VKARCRQPGEVPIRFEIRQAGTSKFGLREQWQYGFHLLRLYRFRFPAWTIVALVGAADRLVGRSHECDWPPSIKQTPILTRSRTDFTTDGSAGVDERVSAAIANNESLYDLDEALLTQLDPDLIITQDLCSVCSIDLPAVRRVADRLSQNRPTPVTLLSLNPQTVEGVLDDVLTVGDAVGEPDSARDQLMRLRSRLIAAQEFVSPYAATPVVGFLEWTDPLFIAGHWTVQLIERAGGRHPLNETVADDGAGAAAGLAQGLRKAGPSTRVTPEALADSKPEFLVICPCGLTLDQTREQVAQLADEPWWHDLPAVRDHRVVLVDGAQFFNRPGPRLVDAYEWLVGLLNDLPDLMPEGFPWRWLG